MKRPERANCVAVFLGQTGCGKTYKLTHEFTDVARRLIVADPESKFPVRRTDTVLWKAVDLVDYLREAQAADPATAFRVILRDEDPERMCDATCGSALAVRNVTLCLDEIVWFCSNRKAPKRLLKVVQVGRDRRVNVVLTTREPQEIPGILLGQASIRYIGHMDPGTGRERTSKLYRLPELEIESLGLGEFRTFGEVETTYWFGREGLDFRKARTLSSRP